MTLRFENKGSNIFVSNAVKADLSGGRSDRRFTVVYRIDGRNAAEGFRVDRGGIMGWEAIDGGAANAPRTLKEARALAARHLSAIEREGTLTPSGV